MDNNDGHYDTSEFYTYDEQDTLVKLEALKVRLIISFICFEFFVAIIPMFPYLQRCLLTSLFLA